jgi:hypothetical protein
MRFVTKLLAALVLVMASGDMGLGATNCGFLTIEQCRGNRDRRQLILRAQSILQSAKACQGRHKRQEVRAYAMPYDPYPWCAFYSDPGN